MQVEKTEKAEIQVIKVGIADMNIACAPARLRTTGLGSCVGVALYDPVTKWAGLVHVMLPSSELSRGPLNRAKFADTAIPGLVSLLAEKGVPVRRLTAKLAGGAQMFSFNAQNELMRIGPRNVEACKAALKKLDIPILAEDTGGSQGRTIEFDSLTGKLFIRTVNQGEKVI